MSQFPETYLESIHKVRGVGFWRELYLSLFAYSVFRQWDSIIELGAGAPDFLARVPFARRAALDVGACHAESFAAAGVPFHVANLEEDSLDNLGRFDVAVCSDVFEHLLWPAKALRRIPRLLTDDGILISHVPNEYSFIPTMLIMAGVRDGMYFHKDQKEWEDPHIRRFTNRGYRAFLGQAFQYNIDIGPLRYRPAAKILHALRLPVPYALQGGPTYISTNSEKTYNSLKFMGHRAFRV